MLVRTWSFSYTGNILVSTKRLARDIISLLHVGQWPDYYTKDFSNKLYREIETIINWEDVIDGVKENLQECVTFEPLT